MDRLILPSQYPSIRAVVLPPAFDGGAYLAYVVGPSMSTSKLSGTGSSSARVPQRITGVFPTWEQAVALIVHLQMPFLVQESLEEEMVAVEPRFRMPIENPLCEPGIGWHIISDKQGTELAIRRCPLMCFCDITTHPYFYAISGRRDKDHLIWTSSHATPHYPDYLFPDLDLWTYVRELDRAERNHPEGFVLTQN